MSDNNEKKLLLRLSPTLYADLLHLAEDEFRSVNGQIEYLLSVAVKKRKGDVQDVREETRAKGEV